MTAATGDGLEQLLATKEIVVFCGSGGVGKTSVAAAAALGAASRLGGKVLVLTIDPARRLATALGLDGIGNRGAPGAARGAESGRARAARRALGRDARHQAVAGTTSCCGTRRTKRRRTGSSRTGCTTTSPRASCRATTTSRWSGCTRSTRAASTTSSSSTRRRRGTRSTSSKRPRAWPTSSAAGCCAGSRCRTGSAASAATRVLNVASRPFYQMADRVLGQQVPRGHRRVLPATSSRCTTGSSTRANAVERLLHDRRTTFAVVTTLEAAPLHEAERFCAELIARNFHLGALVLEQDAARLPAQRRRRGRGDGVRRRCRRDRRVASSALRPGARGSGSCRAGAAHGRRVVPQLRGRRDARSGAARRARARVPTSSCACRTSRSTSAMSTVSPTISRAPRIAERSARRVNTVRRPRATRAPRSNGARPGAGRAARRDLAAARRPLVLRPAAARTDRAARRATASSCSRRCGRSPVRPTTPRTWSGSVIDEVERPLLDALLAHR